MHVEPKANPIEEADTREPEELVLVEQEPVANNTNLEQAQGKPRCILPMFEVLTFTTALHYDCALRTRH